MYVLLQWTPYIRIETILDLNRFKDLKFRDLNSFTYHYSLNTLELF